MLLHHLSMMGHPQLLPCKEDMSALCQTRWLHRPHRRCDDSGGELVFHIHRGRLDTGCPPFVAGPCLGSHRDSVIEESLTATYSSAFKCFPFNQPPVLLDFPFFLFSGIRGFSDFNSFIKIKIRNKSSNLVTNAQTFQLIFPCEILPVNKTDHKIKEHKGGRACGVYDGQNKCMK